jgi:CheY-like chemotaxis protein/HAMP domain-containing protein
MSEPLSSEMRGKLRHDLRTPFNALQGYTEMLLETADEDNLRDLVPAINQINEQSRELLAGINQALTGDREIRPADLHKLGLSVLEQLGPLTLLVEQTSRVGREMASHNEDVFDRLETAARSLQTLTREKLLSAGLGEAQPLPGTVVSIKKPTSSRSQGQLIHPGSRILVTDDSESNRDLLCRRLEREGCITKTASNGREALAKLAEEDFDLVLLDLLMPELDGYETLCAIKGDGRLREIPVIMISALDELTSVVSCIEEGAEDYLPKPFDPVLLRARVGACLEKKRLRDKELEYLRGVRDLEQAAAQIEIGQFEVGTLEKVASRQDELGNLARVFQRMAEEVKAREERMKQELEQLRIHEIVIDNQRVQEQVKEVTGQDLFENLKSARDRFRKKK